MPALPNFRERDGFIHPYLDVLPESDWFWGWRDGSALAMLFHGKTSPLLVVLGEQIEDVANLMARSSEIAPSCRITLQRKNEELLTGDLSRWDWMGILRNAWQPPAVPDIIDLGLEHNDEINDFLAVASPTASTAAGDPEIVTWHGIREQSALICVGAATRWKSGAAHLVSIATHPDHRGRGLAQRVTTSLTQMFFDRGEQRVTLGLYADNLAAKQTYTKVGFQLLESFSSSSRP